MQYSLAGKVALVTGGARDIGRATSRALAASGASVVVNYHDSKSKADELISEIKGAGGQAIAVRADVTKPDDVDALVTAARDAFGGSIDILINNAGGLVARKTMREMDVA